MYEDWFVLEFPPVQQESTLSLFSNNEYESLHTAVRTYITWCSVLTKDSHPSVPLPLRADPERYTREMICALRGIFMKRNHGKKTDFPMLHKTSLDVDICTKRQAQEIQAILRGITSLTMNCSEKHRNFVQNVSLQFLLNSSDLLLSGQTNMVNNYGLNSVVQTVFDEFLRSSLLEQIPSPSYWKTLSVLCRRWRHQVPLVENWARKVLSLSVLIVQELFGPDYLDIPSIDISNDNQQSSLHLCWFQMLHLLGNPANIIDFDPCKDGAISHNFVEAFFYINISLCLAS
uniref:RALGAPB_N domain-containing protein n=1 Tax=Syphacia muris TaxID=451379 RepID=A0A0N5AU91_9BILA